MSLLGAAAIGGGISLLGSAFNFGSQKSANNTNIQLAREQNQFNQQLQDREFAFNREQSELEYQRNLEKWNLENAYNSPSAQMQRYIDAGLNPNLIYGSGSASAGNAQTAPQFTAAKYSAPRFERANVNAPQFNFDPYQAVSFANALSIQKAQKDQISAQADFTRQQTKNAAIDNLIKTVQRSGLEFDYNLKKDLRNTVIDQAKANLVKTTRESDNLQITSDLNRAKVGLTKVQVDYVRRQMLNLRTTDDLNKFKLKLLKMGISDRDNIFVRLASRIVADAVGDSVDGSFTKAIVNSVLSRGTYSNADSIRANSPIFNPPADTLMHKDFTRPGARPVRGKFYPFHYR